ncbi:MAG TPA: phosphotransferase [Streptosporangiaceae bacterium]|nr:phosphotransferase [Streptosporangiaceae bacterium]
MISDVTADVAAFREVLGRIDPDLRLVSSRDLAGGVSAQVTALVAVSSEGLAVSLVIRQYGERDWQHDPQIAAHEYHLLSLLNAAGLRVPRPVLADESGAVLPGPYLVIEYVDGDAMIDPALAPLPQSAVISQLATELARIHDAAVPLGDLSYLTQMTCHAASRIRDRPVVPDESLSEPAVRAALDRIWPPPVVNEPVLLHGDFWPGNTLWRDGALVAVIDWEDAATGDPVADVGNARMEICIGYGAPAAAEFARQYHALRPRVDMSALPHWDLYAALRHAGRMGTWGLPQAELARLQSGHREFVASLLDSG